METVQTPQRECGPQFAWNWTFPEGVPVTLYNHTRSQVRREEKARDKNKKVFVVSTMFKKVRDLLLYNNLNPLI